MRSRHEIYGIALALGCFTAWPAATLVGQTIDVVSCDGQRCPSPLTLTASASVTLTLGGTGLEDLVEGQVVDARGRSLGDVRVALGRSSSAGSRTMDRRATRSVTLTVVGTPADDTGLQLRLTTSRGRSVVVPVDLSIDSGRPTITSANPANVVISLTSPVRAATVDLTGTNLDLLTGVRVVDGSGRLVYHVRAELEPGGDTQRTVRLTVPDDAHQAGPYGTPLRIMVGDPPDFEMPSGATVEVPALHDLYISACSVTPTSPNPGWYQVSIDITNHGSNTAPVALNAGSVLAELDGMPSSWWIQVPGGGLYLAPGATFHHEYRVTWNQVPNVALYRLRPHDRNLLNNERSCPVPADARLEETGPDRSDLTVSQVSVTPASGPPSTEFVVSVIVTNQGPDPLDSNAQVTLRCSIPGDGWRAVPALVPGESRQLQFTVDYPLPPGEKTTVCTVEDSQQRAGDPDDSNNSNSATFTVTSESAPAPADHDLRILSVATDPPAPAGPYQLVVTVRNEGTSTVPEGHVGAGCASATSGGLYHDFGNVTPGQTFEARLTPTGAYTAPGNYACTFDVAAGAVSLDTEQYAWSVGQFLPDLEITSMWLYPDHPRALSEYYLWATIENHGPGTASASGPHQVTLESQNCVLPPKAMNMMAHNTWDADPGNAGSFTPGRVARMNIPGNGPGILPAGTHTCTFRVRYGGGDHVPGNDEFEFTWTVIPD